MARTLQTARTLNRMAKTRSGKGKNDAISLSSEEESNHSETAPLEDNELESEEVESDDHSEKAPLEDDEVESWILKMVEHPMSEKIEKPLEDATKVLKRLAFPSPDMCNRMYQIINHLPMNHRGDALFLEPEPTDMDLELADEAADLAIKTLKDELMAKTNDVKRMIETFTKAIELYVNRYIWMKESASFKLQNQHEATKKELKRFETLLKKDQQEAHDELNQCRNGLQQQIAAHSKIFSQLKQEIRSRVTATAQNRFEELEMAATFQVLQNNPKNVVTSWQNAQSEVNEYLRLVDLAKDDVAFHSTCENLFRAVNDFRQRSMVSATKDLELETEKMTELVTNRLHKYVPELTKAILRYSAFQRRRKKKADGKVKTLSDEVEEHVELFQDEAETHRNQTTATLTEFRNISLKVQVELQQLATDQEHVWTRIIPQLPSKARDFVFNQLSRLSDQLKNGPIHHTFQAFRHSKRPQNGKRRRIPEPQVEDDLILDEHEAKRAKEGCWIM